MCEEDWTVMSETCDKFIAIWSLLSFFTVALDVVDSDSVDGHQRFGGTHCLHFGHKIQG
jgi:hypothetical protein